LIGIGVEVFVDEDAIAQLTRRKLKGKRNQIPKSALSLRASKRKRVSDLAQYSMLGERGGNESRSAQRVRSTEGFASGRQIGSRIRISVSPKRGNHAGS